MNYKGSNRAGSQAGDGLDEGGRDDRIVACHRDEFYKPRFELLHHVSEYGG